MRSQQMAEELATNFMCTEEEAMEYLAVYPYPTTKKFIEFRMALGLTHKQTLAAMKAVKENR